MADLRSVGTATRGPGRSGWQRAVPALALLAVMPAPAAADVITPLSYLTLPLLPPIVLVEALLFRVLARRWLTVPIGTWRILFVTLVANLATSLLGTLVPLYRYVAANLAWLGLALLVSVLVEWAIDLALLGRARSQPLALLRIAALVNLASYVLLAALILQHGDRPPGPPALVPPGPQ